MKNEVSTVQTSAVPLQKKTKPPTFSSTREAGRTTVHRRNIYGKHEVTSAEFVRQSEVYPDAALEKNIVCVEKEGRHIYLLGDQRWKMLIKALSKLLSAESK